MSNIKTYRQPPILLSDALYQSASDTVGKEIQILRAGKFTLMDGEEVDVTPEHIAIMVQNHKNKVKKIDIMLDFAHESDKEAAAWFQNVYTSEDGKELWSTVDWTSDGEEAVRKKKYRYISADFSFNYIDNETGINYGPTLHGAGLTNRPVIKGMQPTTLSETKPLSKDDKMTELELAKKEAADLKAKLDARAVELSEAKSAAKKAEDDKKLADEKAKNDIKLAEEKAANDKKLAEKKAKFDKKLSEMTVVEAQRDAFMNDNMDEFLEKAVVTQKATTGDNGKGGEGSDSKTPAQDEVMTLSEKMAKEEKIPLHAAVSKVLASNKKLSEGYKKETAY